MNNNFLCESYRDFIFIFDKGTNVYFVSNDPTDKPFDPNTFDTNNIDFNNFTQKDDLESVIDSVDEYYDVSLEEDAVNSDEDFIYVLKLKNLNGEYETIEFDDIYNAQRYIDTLKIEGSHEYTEAHFLDNIGNELDTWYIEEDDESIDELPIEENESLNEDADEEDSSNSDESGPKPKNNDKMSTAFNRLPYLDQLKRDIYFLMKKEKEKNKDYLYLDYVDDDLTFFKMSDITGTKFLNENGVLEVGSNEDANADPKEKEDKLYIKIDANVKNNKINFYFKVNLLFTDSKLDKHVDFNYSDSLVDFINDFNSYNWKRLFENLTDKVGKALGVISDKKGVFYDYDSFINYLKYNIDNFNEDRFIGDINNILLEDEHIVKYSVINPQEEETPENENRLSVPDLQGDIDHIISQGGKGRFIARDFKISVVDIIKNKPQSEKYDAIVELVVIYLVQSTKNKYKVKLKDKNQK